MFDHKDNVDQRHRFTRRALLVGAGQVGALGYLGSRLHEIQVLYGPRYKVLAEDNRIRYQPVAPQRGRILDRDGAVLADNLERLEINVVPDQARDLAAVLDRLQTIVTIAPQERQRVLKLAGRQSKLIPIPIEAELDWDQFARINLLAPELPGIATVIGSSRRYAGGRDLGHLVGYVGQVEELSSDVAPVLRLPGMRIGKAGVELGMEEVLRGEPGQRKMEVNAFGRMVRLLDEQSSKIGQDVRLTVSSSLQSAVMRRISSEKQATSVVMDCHSGDVLAMASYPSFDPATFADGISKTEWAKLVGTPGDPLHNRAIRSQYPPASTFKIVTALAGLDAGVIDAKTSFTCSGSLEFGGHKFGCWNRGGHGPMRLHEAMKQSCDVYFYEVARALGIDRLADMARRMGLGETYDCGIALQKPGIVPSPAWKMANKEKVWYGGETLLAGIGQGFVLTTPLQLAVMTARLASGRALSPRLAIIEGGSPERQADLLDISPQHLDLVRNALYGVVNERGGTGSNAQLGSGIAVAGKTGTAQVSRASRTRSHGSLPYRLRDHALFVAYAPANAPRFAVSAVVEHGGSGGNAAAPLARDILSIVIDREAALARSAPELDTGPMLPERNLLRRS